MSPQTRTIEVPERFVPVLVQITPRTNGAKKLANGEIVGRCHLDMLEPIECKDGRVRFCPVGAGSVTVFRNADGSHGLPLTPAARNHKAIYVDPVSELGQRIVGCFEGEPAEADEGEGCDAF